MTALEFRLATVLRAIVFEAAGPGDRFSGDSYLPAHLIYDAREALEDFDRAEEEPEGLRALGEANEALKLFESLS